MKRWPPPLGVLALTVAWLVAACGLTPALAVPPTPLPAPLASNTPRLRPTPVPLVVFTLTPPPTAGSLTQTPWPTVQTATPLLLPDLDATSTAEALAQAGHTLAPPAATQAAATLSPANPVPPSITAFTIAPPQIMPGQPVTLTWQATGEHVTIQRLDALGRLGEFYHVAPSGSLQLSTPPEQRGEAQFMLFAASGASSAQAVARVVIVCPDTWFFANPPSLCPASPPHSTVMQAQHFEQGLMLWTQYNDRIYILYDTGQPRWDALANAWFPGQPENDPSLVPPAGLYQPVRGFGAAWRTGYVSPVQVVRDRLGWATDEEFGVPNAHMQCDSAPKYSRCYLTGPGGVVVVLEPERSGWRMQ
jgi:hypothetical protein